MKLWIARTEDDDLQLFPEEPFYRKEDRIWSLWKVWTPSSHILSEGSLIAPSLFPEVTFENSPAEIDVSLSKAKDNQRPPIEYVEFEGTVIKRYKKKRFNDWEYYISAEHPLLKGRDRCFKHKQGCFKVSTAPNDGDKVLLRYRATKARSKKAGYEIFDVEKAKIIKVL